MEHRLQNVHLKISCEEDCGNSPKKQLLKEFNIAFASGNADFILEQVTDDVVWNMVGDQQIRGRDNFAELLEQMKDNQATEVHIHHIITHGNTAAANGTIVFGENRYAFCDIYVFNNFSKNARIKEITSFVIEEKTV